MELCVANSTQTVMLFALYPAVRTENVFFRACLGNGRRAAPQDLHYTLDEVFPGERRVVCPPLLNVEVALKAILSIMPFGVFTYTQLRRELRRCVEAGEPWPFVLAVIPTSSRKAKVPASRAVPASREVKVPVSLVPATGTAVS